MSRIAVVWAQPLVAPQESGECPGPKRALGALGCREEGALGLPCLRPPVTGAMRRWCGESPQHFQESVRPACFGCDVPEGIVYFFARHPEQLRRFPERRDCKT